jgi:PAS domain S-box-containing protein
MTNRGSISHSKHTVHRSLKTPDFYFHQLVDAVSDYAVFLLDSHGAVISWNRGAEKINGYRADEVIGRNFSIFFPAEAIKKVWPQYELMIAKGEGRFEEEGWRLRKDSSQYWAHVTITAIKDESNNLNGFLKIVRDLTAQKQAEEQRLRLAHEHAARQKAEAANREKDRILHVLSHELRTPLMPILFSSSMLADDRTLPDSVREHLQVIQKNATIEARLIENLLDVTKVEKGKLQLSLRPANVHDVLRTVIEDCAVDLENKRLSLSIELEATEHLLDADSDRLGQVFWNLLKNAIQYTENAGHLVIRSTNPHTDWLRIEFTDSGKGIPPELITRIFEAFEQGEQCEGLGLGLAISKAIVELHGGTINAASDGIGRGSTFAVEFPLGQRFALLNPNLFDKR